MGGLSGSSGVPPSLVGCAVGWLDRPSAFSPGRTARWSGNDMIGHDAMGNSVIRHDAMGNSVIRHDAMGNSVLRIDQ